MFTPKTSRHFTVYTDPVTGVVSYLLKNETAPMQKLVYYVSKNWTRDCRWFWFCCAYPPGGLAEGSQFTAGVIDFETDEIYYHPDIPAYGSCCDQQTGELYYKTGNLVLAKMPQPGSPVRRIGKVPAKYRTFEGRVATHLTFSADGRELCCDIESGNEVYITSLNIETGEFTEWHHRHGGWNHAQFNPVDNDIIMFAMEFWQDIKTGVRHIIASNPDGRRTRTWTIRRGEDEAVLHLPKYFGQSHEWWSANGRYIYYCDADRGVGRIDIGSGEHIMYEIPVSTHAYSTADDRYLCCDRFLPEPGNPFYRGCPTKSAFYNIESGRMLDMVTLNPPLYTPDDPCVYHIDPHPRFVFNDEWIAQVTTVSGQVTVAFTEVAPLIEATK